MKLEKHIIELMTLLEKSEGIPTYTYIPQLIREEIAEFRIKPTYVKDAKGGLMHVELTLEVDEFEKVKQSA